MPRPPSGAGERRGFRVSICDKGISPTSAAHSDMETRDISLLFGRVESYSNIADGSSWNDLSHVLALKDKFIEPVYPAWVLSTWNLEVSLPSSQSDRRVYFLFFFLEKYFS